MINKYEKLKKNSGPDSDCLSVAFYKLFWNEIKTVSKLNQISINISNSRQIILWNEGLLNCI